MPEPLTGALAGIRVLDLAPLGPGGHCSKLLADLGADVVRIVEAGESAGRRGGRRLKGDAPLNYGFRRNTRAIGMNLKHPAVRAIFFRLLSTADVLMVGMRPAAAERLGLDAAALCPQYPRLVYAQLSGFGATGPYAQVAGHDLNYQAIAGLLDLNRTAPAQPPAPPGATVGDSSAGLAGAVAILAALLARGRTGRGQYLDLAATDTVFSLLTVAVETYLQTGESPRFGGTDIVGKYPFYGVYETRDGGYVAVAAMEPYFYENLCRLLGLEQYIPHQRAEEPLRSEIFAAFRRVFRTRTRAEWTALLMHADTCVTPVNTLDEALADPHLQARGMLVDWPDAAGNRRRMVGPAFKLSDTPVQIRHILPETGAETAAILATAGISAADVAALQAEGAII